MRCYDSLAICPHCHRDMDSHALSRQLSKDGEEAWECYGRLVFESEVLRGFDAHMALKDDAEDAILSAHGL